jgi:hypothetical protein
MGSWLSDDDKKAMRSGVFIWIGGLAMTAVGSALGAVWAIVKESDWRVVSILIAIAIFLGFFAIALFLDWRDGRKTRALFRTGSGSGGPIIAPAVPDARAAQLEAMKRARDKAVEEEAALPKAALPLLQTPEGRKEFVDGLVVFHAQGVGLQTGPNALWPTEQAMIDWLSADGQWLGEILGHMRAYGCSHAEIHDIGYLTPPRYVGSFPSPSVPPYTNLAGRYRVSSPSAFTGSKNS